MNVIILLKSVYYVIKRQYEVFNRVRPDKFGEYHKNDMIENFQDIKRPDLLYIGEHVKVRAGFTFISKKSKLIIGKFSAIATGVTVVTGNHQPTVGVPHNLLGLYHINDHEKDMVIEEEVWVGVNATLIHGTRLSRGVIVGACSLVNKYVPPYAVVAGIPAKIIAVKFTKEQIIEHEKALYKENERLNEHYLDELFEKYYKNVKSIGVTTLTEEQKNYVFSFLSSINE